MDSELKEYLEAMEGQIGGHLDATLVAMEGRIGGHLDATLVAMEGRIGGHLDATLVAMEGRVGGLLDATLVAIEARLDAKIESVETTLLTEFHKWASPAELRARSHAAAIRALDLETEALAERVAKLEKPA